MTGTNTALAELQQWVLAAVTSDREPPGEELQQFITPSLEQTPAQRLAVYRHAYQARLIGVLRELFPCTRFAVGNELFDQFCAGYLQAHPPKSYTLNRLADAFPEYLDVTRPRDWGEFLVDLARLEQAIDRVFDSYGPENLPPFNLSAAMNGQARLRLVPGCELLTFQYPVSSYYTAWKAGQAAGWPHSAAQYIILLRRNYIVRRHELTASQFRVLTAIQAGATLDEAVTAAADLRDVLLDELAASLEQWFQLWASEGFFAATH